MNQEIESMRKHLAEKDAEIERLKTVPMKYRRMAFNAQLQDENRELEERLAASQANEQKLKSALLIEAMHWRTVTSKSEIKDEINLLFPSDTTALSAMIAKAGEVMRERCASEFYQPHVEHFGDSIQLTIRALPSVTLEDLK